MVSGDESGEGNEAAGGVVQVMDTQLIKRYSELQAASDDIKQKLAAAEARRDDAKTKLAEHVADVNRLGFGTLAELQLAISEAEAEMTVLLEQGEAKLKAGGYA